MSIKRIEDKILPRFQDRLACANLISLLEQKRDHLNKQIDSLKNAKNPKELSKIADDFGYRVKIIARYR